MAVSNSTPAAAFPSRCLHATLVADDGGTPVVPPSPHTSERPRSVIRWLSRIAGCPGTSPAAGRFRRTAELVWPLHCGLATFRQPTAAYTDAEGCYRPEPGRRSCPGCCWRARRATPLLSWAGAWTVSTHAHCRTDLPWRACALGVGQAASAGRRAWQRRSRRPGRRRTALSRYSPRRCCLTQTWPPVQSALF